MSEAQIRNPIFDKLISRYPELDSCKESIMEAYRLMEACYSAGGLMLVAGNGGSAADAEHMVGELMKGFRLPRDLDELYVESLLSVDPDLGSILAKNLQGALPAITLSGHPALTTAYMNDCDPLLCFAQQVNGYGKRGDILFAISTSGNSKNILFAVTVAKAKGMKVIGLTGARESRLSSFADVCIQVPQKETYMVQELHLPVYHCLCLMLEERFWGEKS